MSEEVNWLTRVVGTLGGGAGILTALVYGVNNFRKNNSAANVSIATDQSTTALISQLTADNDKKAATIENQWKMILEMKVSEATANAKAEISDSKFEELSKQFDILSHKVESQDKIIERQNDEIARLTQIVNHMPTTGDHDAGQT